MHQLVLPLAFMAWEYITGVTKVELEQPHDEGSFLFQPIAWEF